VVGGKEVVMRVFEKKPDWVDRRTTGRCRWCGHQLAVFAQHNHGTYYFWGVWLCWYHWWEATGDGFDLADRQRRQLKREVEAILP
jgi:hypothetical protein